MTSDGPMSGERFRMRLPATSANLGPGFDASAVALDFYLEVEADLASGFSIEATGRDADRCGQREDNLVIETYRRLLEREGRAAPPISIRMRNGIPLGMGCGSSAAGRLAAIAMAVHFGGLGWSEEQVLEEASAAEGHPDNAAACWLGGFVTAASEGRKIHVARVAAPAAWRAIVVLPTEPLATSKARAVLPETYSRADVVSNIQSAGLLGLAFAMGRPDLLKLGMRDRVHQPYREAICPLLPRLLPLAGMSGVLGAALSGAGPAVLVVVEGEWRVGEASLAIRHALRGMAEPELLVSRFERNGAVYRPERGWEAEAR